LLVIIHILSKCISSNKILSIIVYYKYNSITIYIK